MKDDFNLIGKFSIYNATTGESRDIYNTIHNAGKSSTAALLLSGVACDPFSHLAIGLGSSTIAVTGSALGSEYLRISGATSQVTTSVTNDTARLIGSFIADATKAVNEAGVFNASSAGSMLARACFAVLNVGSEDRINLTYSVQVA